MNFLDMRLTSCFHVLYSRHKKISFGKIFERGFVCKAEECCYSKFGHVDYLLITRHFQCSRTRVRSTTLIRPTRLNWVSVNSGIGLNTQCIIFHEPYFFVNIASLKRASRNSDGIQRGAG